ncbi:Nup85 nucleoporin-domain-containing protein [Pilobolus umbonatus]|nr:Nup85 nucleoporin-domain-containing protein [Pilobolus umbonatus]
MNEPITLHQFTRSSCDLFIRLIQQSKQDTDITDSSVDWYPSLIDLLSSYPPSQPWIPIWDLCYILYFQPSHLDLENWLESIDPTPSGDPWTLLKHHLLRGHTQEVIDTLSTLHLNTHEQGMVHTLIDLIESKETMPWLVWHETVLDTLHYYSHVPDDVHPDLVGLFLILSGNEDAIWSMGSYFESIVAIINYSRPSMNARSLAEYTQARGYMDKENQVYAYLMMGYLEEALACMGPWLQAHLGYALIAVGAKVVDQEILDPVYYTIEDYALTIAHEQDLWEEAVIYLSACQNESWIIRLLNDPSFVNKELETLSSMVKLCIRYQLPQTERLVRKMMGHQLERQGEWKLATIQYGKALDTSSLDRMAEVIMNKYLKEKEAVLEVVMDSALKQSSRYAVLMDYNQFKTHLNSKDYTNASRLSLKLMKSVHLLPHFDSVLFIDILSILEDKTQYYKSGELIQLIQIFENSIKEPSVVLATYYQLHHTPLPAPIVIAKIRERIAYKAAISQAQS